MLVSLCLIIQYLVCVCVCVLVCVYSTVIVLLFM